MTEVLKPKKMTKKEYVYEIFRRLHDDNPNPKPELDYHNDYTLLVAVALSAQSTDVGVNKATKELFKIVHTPKDMLDLGLENLITHIKTIGLYNTKAKNVMKTAEMLYTQYENKVPNDQKILESLPGVGRKTANVVRNIAFGEMTIAVDTHLFRLANRLKIATGKTPLEVETKLLKAVPKEYLYNSHHWLILHGRYICKARRPLCRQCILKDICKSVDLDYTLKSK